MAKVVLTDSDKIYLDQLFETMRSLAGFRPGTFSWSFADQINLDGPGGVVSTVLYLDEVNQRVGVGIATPLHLLHVDGGNAVIEGNIGLFGANATVAAPTILLTGVIDAAGATTIASLTNEGAGATKVLIGNTAGTGFVTLAASGALQVGTSTADNVEILAQDIKVGEFTDDGADLSTNVSTLTLIDTTAMAQNVGAAIGLQGKITAAGALSTLAAIKALKENNTEAEDGGGLGFYTRANTGALTLAASIAANGDFSYGKRMLTPAHQANTGLRLPTEAGVPVAVAGQEEGDAVWDSTNDSLYVYDGAAFHEIVSGGYSMANGDTRYLKLAGDNDPITTSIEIQEVVDLSTSTASLVATDTTAMADAVGGAVAFRGKITAAGAYSVLAAIKGLKENNTEAEDGGELAFYTRANTGALTVALTLGAIGQIIVPSEDDSGVPGDTTVDKSSGRVAIAIGAADVDVANTLVTATSKVFAVINQAANDATLTQIIRVNTGAGTFKIVGNAAATAAVTIDFIVFN